MNTYFGLEDKDKGEDMILSWWSKASTAQLPLLSKLARWMLASEPSSACSERAFSKAGFVNNRYR